MNIEILCVSAAENQLIYSFYGLSLSWHKNYTTLHEAITDKHTPIRIDFSF